MCVEWYFTTKLIALQIFVNAYLLNFNIFEEMTRSIKFPNYALISTFGYFSTSLHFGQNQTKTHIGNN